MPGGLMNIKEIFDSMIKHDASDAFIKTEGVLRNRIYTEVEKVGEYSFGAQDMSRIISELIDDESKNMLLKNRVHEFTIWHGDRFRFRISIFYQKGTPAIVIRKIDLENLDLEKLNLPSKVLRDLCQEHRGLVLLTGMAGSGKSTTIAAMIDFINRNFKKHILTIEEPIEFIFKDNKSIINQREIGKDVFSYEEALRQATLQCPDVIYVGNIRDRNTCHAALTAAETGVLVFSTIHTVNAHSTVERLVSLFPSEQQSLVFEQLSSLLKGVVSMRLIPRIDTKGLIPAYEVMTLSPTIASLIKDKELDKMYKFIADGKIFGMSTFNQCLLNLVSQKKISPEVALDNSDEKKELKLSLDDFRR
jgi:twitching motility protein PilT